MKKENSLKIPLREQENLKELFVGTEWNDGGEETGPADGGLY